MSSEPQVFSKGKKFLFTLIMISLPVVLFLFLELVLFIFSYGGDLDIFIIQDYHGKPTYVLNKNFTHRYFFKKGIEAPNPRNQTFEVNKSTNTYRIFCLGASTTQGVPYPPNAAFPAMLQHILSRFHPDRKFEVINCGITAITSHSVLDMTREILSSYQPDLLIIYTGHNEFYGVFGQASRLALFDSQFLTQMFLKMQRSKIFLLFRNLYINILGETITRENVVDPETFMGTVALEAGILQDNPVFKSTEKQFQKNIKSIVETAQNAKKNVLICTLVDNVKDLPPFESKHQQGFNQNSRYQYDSLITLADTYLKRDELQESTNVLNQIFQLDSSYALSNYLMGKLYYRLGKYQSALDYFVLAKDLDVIRFRAPSRFNQIIRDLCKNQPNILVDIETAFRVNSPEGIIGNNLILEHIHPNDKGYFLMAQTIARAMSDYQFVNQNWDWSRNFSDSTYLAMNHLSLLSHEVVNAAVYKLQQHWPFSKSKEFSPYRRIGTARTEELALGYVLQRKGTLIKLHLDLGYEYFLRGDYKNAHLEYEAGLSIEPTCEGYNLTGMLYSSQVDRLRGDPGKLQLALRYFNKASIYFKKGLEICPDDIELNYNYGVLLSMIKKGSDEAIRYLQKVLGLKPAHINSRLTLAQLFLTKQRWTTAEKILLDGIELNPEAVEFYKELGELYISRGEQEKALELLRKGISLNHNNQELEVMLNQICPQN
jgi:tetratricopeptide (TPR) repeat protein